VTDLRCKGGWRGWCEVGERDRSGMQRGIRILEHETGSITI
jgi:hypothetical protein